MKMSHQTLPARTARVAQTNQTEGLTSSFRNRIPDGMSPAQYAGKLRREDGANFAEEVDAHLTLGILISTSSVFLMARPMPKGETIESVWDTWPAKECDSWFVWIGVGVARDLLGVMPYPLPWLGWVRQFRGWNRIHWTRTEALRQRLFNGSSQQLISTASPDN